MLVSEDQYRTLDDNQAGYCRACDEVTADYGIEPDARQYMCEVCEKKKLYGIQEAFMCGWIQITD